MRSPPLKTRPRYIEWLLRVVLMLSGVLAALALVWWLSPLLLRSDRERAANAELGNVEFLVGMGDIFIAQYGSIAPPPDPYRVLSRHDLKWDADGFRVPAQPADDYDIIALGDSFTEAPNVALPWPDVLAQETGRAVRNLGFRGYGPDRSLLAYQDYGVQHNPDVVISGFFAGNDLSNVVTFAQGDTPFTLPQLAREAFGEFVLTGTPWDTDLDYYQYPVQVDLGGTVQDVAFLNGYVAWLNVEADELRQSGNLAAVVDSWQRLQTLTPDACLVIAYFPAKAQVYLPHIVEDDQERVAGNQWLRYLTEAGAMLSDDQQPGTTYAELMARRDNLSTVLREEAQRLGLHFIDLTPALSAAAEQGIATYYAYDTHWNQTGHDLAAQEIAQFVTQNCDS